MVRIVVVLTFAPVLLVLALLLTEYRVLIYEYKVIPGEHFVVEDYGDLGESRSASLVCTYFTGRSIATSVYWFSANNIMGRDSCSFIFKP